MSTCPLTDAAVRLADCRIDPRFVQLNRADALMLPQHCSPQYAPVPEQERMLHVLRRAKVRA